MQVLAYVWQKQHKMNENLSEDEQAKSKMKFEYITGSCSVSASDISDDLRGDPINKSYPTTSKNDWLIDWPV